MMNIDIHPSLSSTSGDKDNPKSLGSIHPFIHLPSLLTFDHQSINMEHFDVHQMMKGAQR
jgi:hypothetical protein